MLNKLCLRPSTIAIFSFKGNVTTLMLSMLMIFFPLESSPRWRCHLYLTSIGLQNYWSYVICLEQPLSWYDRSIRFGTWRAYII